MNTYISGLLRTTFGFETCCYQLWRIKHHFYQLQQHGRVARTIATMPQVPPGSQTGLYYIPVSNLPWNTDWKHLKDFARNQQPDGSCLAIEHAHVWSGTNTTDGWVSVRGHADFLATISVYPIIRQETITDEESSLELHRVSPAHYSR